MPRDVKLLQRGVNVQANDLAVPPGTLLDADNFDFDRDGVAQRRVGFGNNFVGLPQVALDCDQGLFTSGAFTEARQQYGSTRGFFSGFSGARIFHLNNGLMFSGEQNGSTTQWLAMPFAASHNMATIFSGQLANSPVLFGNIHRVGRALIETFEGVGPGGPGQFNWQASDLLANGALQIHGTPGNDPSQALDPATSFNGPMFRTAFDAVANPTSLTAIGSAYVSDDTTIRDLGGNVVAGSVTSAGYVDATGAAARFSGASWLAISNSNDGSVYVADNVNAIRKVTTGGVVTTLAGSITAGDVDGVGSAALFRTISGLAFAPNTNFLYVAESGGHRIRKVDVTTGSVTIFAGALTPTAGHVNAAGTAARFSAPNGLEFVNDSLFIGDTGNGYVRRIVVSSASVTDFAGQGNGSAATGMVSGARVADTNINPCYFGSVTVRGQMSAFPSKNTHLVSAIYLCVECPGPNASTDLGLVLVPGNASVAADSARDALYHYARCPSVLPTATTGNLKLDCWGPNAYRDQDVRGVDVQGGFVFTTTERPRIIDAYSRLNATDSLPRLRPVGIDWPEAPSCTTTSGSTFASLTSWAYRTVCGMTLSTGRTVLGPPSERVIVTNSGSVTVSGSVTAYAAPWLPYDGLPFVQVYRTKTFASSSDPGDQMFLCYEAPLTYGRGVTFVDAEPDALLGAALYTNDTELQFGAASLPPPMFANDAASFAGRLVLANYVDQAFCRIKVLGTSALSPGAGSITLGTASPGIDGDVVPGLALLSLTLTAATVTSVLANQYGIGAGGSAAQNAVQTARNIAYVINRSPYAYMFRAYYDENDPGAISIYSMFPGRSANDVSSVSTGANTFANTRIQTNVTFSTTATAAFLQTSAVAGYRQSANIRWSDQLNPDSFPVSNQATVGASTDTIARVLPIAETLLVVKGRSIYRCDPSFNFQSYNQALSCTLPNSFARLNNQWIGLFTRGFMALTAAQANPIGRPIDRAVQLRYGTGNVIFGTSLADFASAASIDKKGLYVCRFNDKIFAYNDYSKIWDTISWALDAQSTHFGAHGDALLANVADYPRAVLWQLNTPGRYSVFTDLYTDASYGIAYGSGSITINAGSGPLTDTPSAASLLGGVFYQGATLTTIVAATLTNGIYAVTTSPALTSGTATLLLPIAVSALYAPTVSPGSNQRFGDVQAMLELARAGTITATFYNRQDAGLVNSLIPPLGTYKAGAGVQVARVIALPTGAVEFADYLYHVPARFPTPAARAASSELAVRLTEATALQPLAIKSFTVETTPTDNAKVTR